METRDVYEWVSIADLLPIKDPALEDMTVSQFRAYCVSIIEGKDFNPWPIKHELERRFGISKMVQLKPQHRREGVEIMKGYINGN